MERVDIAFYGYDDDPRELFEIQEVRQYVSDLDVKFPFWLFFLSKKHLGLQCLLWCNLPPYLTPEGRADIFPRRIGELLTKRWFPAMNHVCNFAGYSEEQVELLTDRAIEYINNGRLPLDSPVPERLR